MTPDPPFAIEWSAAALRALDRLPEKVGTAAIEFVLGPLADNPERVGHALRFELEGTHSARRGDHRVLYRIDHDEHRVVVLAIEHRSDAYRRH